MLIMNSSASPSQEIPIECESLYFKRKLHNVPPKVNVALVSSLVLNCVTFPFTVVLNLLVIAAVKTRQRLRTNSNVVIACLETTDLLVGVFVQPFYFPVVMSVISTLEGDLSSTTCLIRLTFSNGLGMFCGASLFQLVLMTVERLLAIFRPYSHNVCVTEGRIVAASIVAWVVNLLFTIIYLVFKVKFLFPVLAIFWLSLVIIIVGQFILYREARRHKTQIRAQQVAVKMESRQKFEKEKKALKLTTYVVLTMLLFYFPITVIRLVLSKVSLNITYIILFIGGFIPILNSVANPIIYAARLRQFRVAFLEIILRKKFTEAQQIEMRLFCTRKRGERASTRIKARKKRRVEDINISTI